MSRCVASTLLMLACLVTAARDARADLDLIAGGKSDYAIVVQDAPDPGGNMRHTAATLQRLLREATGVQLPRHTEGKFKGGPAIYVGITKAAAEAGVPTDGIKGWSCRKTVRGRDVFLVGRLESVARQRRRYVVDGARKAVTWFLEEEVGVRFLLPGPYGIYVPKVGKVTVPGDLDATWTPKFKYVTSRATSDSYYNAANSFVNTPLLYTYGGHSYYDAVPTKKYGKTNPEYFALIGGVRTPSKNHLCISNPDVQRLMIEEMERRLDAGFEWVELAQTDGYVPCACEKCKAIHADPGERLWIVHRKLAAEMKKRRPGKMVMTIQYGPTRHAPTSFKRFPDNVVIQMCGYTPEELETWEQLGVRKTVYLYNWGSYHTLGFGPKRTPRYAADQVRRFAENGVLGIYLCGGFECPGLEGPVYYVYGKMLGNPQLSHEALLEDYYRAAYGKARAPMKAFFDAMFKRMELYSVLRRPNFKTDRYGVDSFRTPEDAYCHFFPAKLLTTMQANLDRAKAAAKDPRAKARIRLVEYEFRVVKNLATIFHLYRAYRLKPNWTTFDLLAEEIEARKALIDEYFPRKGGRAELFDGWFRLYGAGTREDFARGGRLSGILSAPINWNTKLLKKMRVLPGVGTRKTAARRVTGIQLDGALDEPAWAHAKTESLNEIGMGELKNAARFKTGYDDRHLYFAFECDLAGIEHLEITPMGLDGKCYQTECLEIFVDPFGQREKYCQFIVNPWPNSRYDARFGFIDDPIHPMYNRADRSWNGTWDYAAHIDKAGKKWTAEVRIPFATLGVAEPKPGATWTMNVGREEYPLPKARHGEPTLSLWSPNLESKSFHARSAFGELVFE